MGIFEKLFGRKKKEEPKVEEKTEEQEPEPIDGDLLDLGWYWSGRKKEWQMAKIREEDRKIHFYVVGASGTGKSKFLEFLIRQDVRKGNGFGVIDPHGDLIEDVKGYLALALPRDELEERVVLIDPLMRDILLLLTLWRSQRVFLLLRSLLSLSRLSRRSGLMLGVLGWKTS